jgi:nanoRNase/pAp phosphatase (c-di-AMP/oligoRNAs hydrolase)
MITARTRRSDRLLRVLSDFERVTVVTHDNPDPDAIAAGWALLEWLRRQGQERTGLIGRGAIVRAENVQMMRVLDPPLSLTDELPADGAAVVLVDCAPSADNHLLSASDVRPVAVIDHHPPNGRSFRVRLRDVRPRAAATTSIVASYLREHELEPGPNLATAMLYAIRTETVGRCAPLSRADRGILAWLSGLADHGKLAQIMNAPLTREYFSDLRQALENARTYDGAAICLLPQVSGAEIAGEVADLLIRCERIDRALCGAAVGDALVFSARTTREGGDAAALLGRTLNRLGSHGGHKHRAGGKIAAPDAGGRQRLWQTIRERWLAACHAQAAPGRPLVAPRGRLRCGSRRVQGA